MATSQNRFALLPDDDSGLTPEEVDEEMEKAKKLSLKSYEREKKRNRGRNENRLLYIESSRRRCYPYRVHFYVNKLLWLFSILVLA